MKSVYRDDPHTYWERVSYWDRCLQAVCRTLAHENHVKDECLEIAVEALKSYANTFTGAPGYALSVLIKIEQRLAQLEEETE